MSNYWVHKLPASWRPHVIRVGFNFHPAYRRTGGRVEYVSPDLSHLRIRLPLNRGTRNMVGSIFGGSLFGVTDGQQVGYAGRNADGLPDPKTLKTDRIVTYIATLKAELLRRRDELNKHLEGM